MKRQEKAITDAAEIDQIINSCDTCRLGLSLNNQPYVIPISFGYDGERIYIHTAAEGRKIDYFEGNPEVCVEFDQDVTLVTHESSACKWTADYRSVICFGRISEIIDSERKIDALNQIMIHYSGRSWEYHPNQISRVRVWQIDLLERFGKSSQRG